MNYQKIYNQIIERAKNRQLEGYKEKHHILPKCLGGNNDKDNLIELTAREHFLCHRLLCEIYPNNDKLWYALFLMSIGKNKHRVNTPYVISSRTYEYLRLKFIETSKNRKISHFQKEKIAESNSKKVNQYDFNGSYIKTFNSAADAERSISNKPNEHWKKLRNNIDACCRGEQKSAYGYIWKWEGELLYLEKHKGSSNNFAGKKIKYNNQLYKSQSVFFKETGISNYMFYKLLKQEKIEYVK